MSSSAEIKQSAIKILSQNQYQVYSAAHPDIEMCFELIAEHITRIYPNLVIKIIPNIDNIKPQFFSELKILASIMAAVPMLLGVENRRSNLDDNVIYSRENLIAINIRTFSNVMQNPQLPMAIAKQGGFFIDVDGEKLQQLRENANISRQALAEKLHLTPKAVSQYEKNEMRASLEHSKLIEEILGDSILAPQDFFKFLSQSISNIELDGKFQRKATAKQRDFMEEITEYVLDAGQKIFWTKNAPFDMFIYQDNEDTHEVVNFTLVGGTYTEKEYQNTEKYRFQVQFFQHVP